MAPLSHGICRVLLFFSRFTSHKKKCKREGEETWENKLGEERIWCEMGVKVLK